MAEAAVESQIPKYFCHQCGEKITPVLPDYTCPKCLSGFIEEVDNIPKENESSENSNHLEEDAQSGQTYANLNNRQFADILENLFSSASRTASTSGHEGPTGHSNSHSNTDDSQTDPHGIRRTSQPDAAIHNVASGPSPHVLQFRIQRRDQQGQSGHGGSMGPSLDIIQQIISSITEQPGHAQAGGARGMINIDFSFPLFQVVHGNPGDYAWGNGGLDAVITQLLNQLDATGPPPMPKIEIDQIPTVSISQEQIDKNLQCSVCMEDFKLDENVRQLNCAHCYHNECIVPWLELHGTCPICRKVLNENNTNQARNHRRTSQRQFSNSNTGSSLGGNANYEFLDDYD